MAFRFLVEEAEQNVAAHLGPLISWEAPPSEGDWDLVMSGIDLDNAAFELGTATLARQSFDTPDGWSESPLDLAASAYKRAFGWDHSPGEGGIWLVMSAPVSGVGGENGPWHYKGHLTGFVVLYDRGHEGFYESVGHIWTAASWKRRGIARRLLSEARSRFPIKEIEGPYSADGAAFIESCAQDLL
ncbi:hypothetical protein [Actinomadura oligospora]|uniref:hypothetical protein n=1 Tax=Actinomadura oligospora TaxID=111804 RepID=UPI00047B6CE9|nr:hypothetical protein [Actinomadura oligospora]